MVVIGGCLPDESARAALEWTDDANQRVERDHRETQCQLQAGSDDQAQSCAQPGSTRVVEVAAVAEFPSHGASERPDENSRQAEEEPQESAQARANGGPGACSEAACPKSTCREVDSVGEKSEEPEYHQADRSDILEIIGPGGHEKTGENERCAGQKGQDEPCQTHDDQGCGEQM